MIEAIVICDSISPAGIRLTTMKLRYPKFIHGEFMTHRVFSRNASSSRAVPIKKSLEEVRSDTLRATPIWWGKNQPGMQADEELSDDDAFKNQELFGYHVGSTRDRAKAAWRAAAMTAASRAEVLEQLGAHKQIVNRVLEPYLHINVVFSTTELENFFGLRLHAAAMPEMRMLAEAMWEAYKSSDPHKVLDIGLPYWHLPFVNVSELLATVDKDKYPNLTDLDISQRVSVARCARVSYESFETGKRSTVDEDLALYNRLLTSGHWSPFEHQATPDERLVNSWSDWKHTDHGNFVGWRQLRKMMPGENVAPLPEKYR